MCVSFLSILVFTVISTPWASSPCHAREAIVQSRQVYGQESLGHGLVLLFWATIGTLGAVQRLPEATVGGRCPWGTGQGLGGWWCLA